MVRVLFVCHGNICRSTMGEFIMKNLVEEEGLEDEFYIESAGSSVYDPDSPVYPLAKDCLYRNGITNLDINKKKSRNVVKKDKDNFDYILIAEDDNLNGVLRVIGNDASDKVFKILDFAEDRKRKGKDIDDPWYTRNFDKSFDDIMMGCQGFINYLKKHKHI